MKKVSIQILKLILSGCISLALLSLFCYFYNYTGRHVINEDGSTDYKWEANQYFSNMKEGFAWFRFDADGFNNPSDAAFTGEPVDILLLGSSHMEAVQIPKDQNTAALLGTYFPEKHVYNLGVSSHTIFSCVQNLPAAVEKYKPTSYVILETDSIAFDVDAMRNSAGGVYPEVETVQSGILYEVQKRIPAVKSLYKAYVDWKNVSAWHGSQIQFEGPAEPFIIPEEAWVEYEEVLRDFLGKAKASMPASCQLLIFYHPRTLLDEAGEYHAPDAGRAGKLFVQVCKELDIIFVDLSEDFEKLYVRENILAHGFINGGVGIGHLNARGHQVIAEVLYKTILEREETR